ncbi:hypothetical protein LXA43DRAFT_1065050 [Ganoderma leucocontextum]|nr:hypothetical protein LXA43DRAFT_1065050 [Ganoderma leucocontextum]
MASQTTRALLCLGAWSKAGYVKSTDLRKAAQLPELDGDASDFEMEEGWDAIDVAARRATASSNPTHTTHSNLPYSESATMSDDEDIPELIDIAIEPDISPGPLSESIESAPEKLAAPTYDFDNEPDKPWDAFCPAPSQRVDPKVEVRLIFTHHWLLDDMEERGTIGRPPRWLGMEIQADGFSRSINIPKSFKEAHSTSPAAYREYWLSLKRSSAFSLLTANQKDVI